MHFKLPALPRVDPFRFEIDERFPGLTVHTLPAEIGERQGIIADDTQHGVNDAFDGYAICGNGGGDRIHQKWHVVIVERNPHHQTALRIGEAIERDGGSASFAMETRFNSEPGGLFRCLGVEAFIFAGQRRFSERRNHSLQQAFVQFSGSFSNFGGRHEIIS